MNAYDERAVIMKPMGQLVQDLALYFVCEIGEGHVAAQDDVKRTLWGGVANILSKENCIFSVLVSQTKQVLILIEGLLLP